MARLQALGRNWKIALDLQLTEEEMGRLLLPQAQMGCLRA